jgi:hypothetical protein
MASDAHLLQICYFCQQVCDVQDPSERWFTKQSYRENTGIDLADCTLTYTYCAACYSYLLDRQAA